MNPTRQDDAQPALYAFVKQEFGSQLTILQQAIKEIRINQQISRLGTEEFKSVQTLKEVCTITHLHSLVHLFQALERYLQILKQGKKIILNHFDLLEESLQELRQIAIADDIQIGHIIQDKAPTVDRWTAALQRYTSELQEGITPTIANQPLKTVQEAFSSNLQKKSFAQASEIQLDSTMFDLFRVELETQSAELNQGIIILENMPKDRAPLESLMRAAHSIKGAARIVSLVPIVRLAHCIEDLFVMAQKQQLELCAEHFDRLLRGVDILMRLSKVNLSDINDWLNEQTPSIEQLIAELGATKQEPPLIAESPISKSAISKTTAEEVATLSLRIPAKSPAKIENTHAEIMKAFQRSFASDRVLRVTAQSINHLMGLAGESLVESRWLYPFEQQLQKLKKKYDNLGDAFDNLREKLRQDKIKDELQSQTANLAHQINDISHQLMERLNELDDFIRRHSSLSDRLYQEVINSRMRPFADGVRGFPRMVRDLARQLGKRVKLNIEGKSTPVDRDILEKLEAPLSHFLRNAVDHGIELPDEREALGKSPEGTITLEARHRGGMLAIRVSDDGRGVDIEKLRKKIIEKKLTNADMAYHLSDVEVLDFLFLPGFSTASQVTEISGRGVGLDVVQNVIREVGGIVRTSFLVGNGMTFDLQLPLTLSVIRSLLVTINGEIYAFPLARIDRALLLPTTQIEIVEGRQFFHEEHQNIGLVAAWQILELPPSNINTTELPVVIVSDRLNRYGIVVDRIIGEKELVVQELDERLNKVPDISAASLMEDGTPVLIIDVEDVVRSIDNILSGTRLSSIVHDTACQITPSSKHILIVDDSTTVREVESRLLKSHGYQVDSAINGVDGWNAIRTQRYDLVVTDVDMPRMNGIELVRMIKQDHRLHSVPVMIVSYKEGEDDREKGLAAGADYYLTKSSFHDTKLLEAVHNLIGDP